MCGRCLVDVGIKVESCVVHSIIQASIRINKQGHNISKIVMCGRHGIEAVEEAAQVGRHNRITMLGVKFIPNGSSPSSSTSSERLR